MIGRTVLVLAIVLGSALATLPSRAELQVVGEIARVRGTAVVSRGDATRMLAPGDQLVLADTVATGEGGRVQISFVDGSVVTLGSRSALRIRDYALEDDGNRLVNLAALNGIFRAVVAPAGDRSIFDVELAFSVASVRSTELLFSIEDEKCAIFVAEGEIDVTHKYNSFATRPVSLSAGQGTEVTGEAPPSAPIMWGQKRIDTFYERTSIE